MMSVSGCLFIADARHSSQGALRQTLRRGIVKLQEACLAIT